MTIQQNYNALLLLNELIVSNPQIVNIIELGTARGGLSVFFGLCMQCRGGKVTTFDITNFYNDIPYAKHFESLGIDYFQKDALHKDTKKLIKGIITHAPKTKGNLLFCDNGNKPEELKYYYKIMRKGDFLLVHDYGDEIKDKDLPKDLFKFYIKYKQDLFDKHRSLILCLRKK